MELRKRIERLQDKPQRCRLEAIRQELEEADRVELDLAIADHTIPSTILATALKEEGRTVSDTTILRHRAGTCPCR
ncbi:MAG: hypothetical protein KGJ86_00215 [Chloroflexota bacterium]|nr:hypothetical protein [Chloroflexota bacterium]